MILKVKLDKGAFAPESAHEADAGYDLRTPYDVFIPAGKFVIIKPEIELVEELEETERGDGGFGSTGR